MLEAPPAIIEPVDLSARKRRRHRKVVVRHIRPKQVSDRAEHKKRPRQAPQLAGAILYRVPLRSASVPLAGPGKPILDPTKDPGGGKVVYKPVPRPLEPVTMLAAPIMEPPEPASLPAPPARHLAGALGGVFGLAFLLTVFMRKKP